MEDDYKDDLQQVIQSNNVISRLSKIIGEKQIKAYEEKDCQFQIEQVISESIESDTMTIEQLQALFPKRIPTFSDELMDLFFDYVVEHQKNSFEFVDAFCYNSKNAIKLYKRGILEIMINCLPETFDLLAKIIEACSSYNCNNWFIEIGGLYALTHFSTDHALSDAISRILFCIMKNITYTSELLPIPSSALYPIEVEINPEEEVYLNSLFFNLRNTEEPIVMSRLYISLANLFHKFHSARKAIGQEILNEYLLITSNPDIRASYMCAVAQCIVDVPFEDPFLFLDPLVEFLQTEDTDFVLASLDTLDAILYRCGIEIFEAHPIIDSVLSLCKDANITVKNKAAVELVNIIESTKACHCEILVRMGVFDFLLEFIDELEDESMQPLMQATGEFIGRTLLEHLPDDAAAMVTEYIEQIEKMSFDHDCEPVREEAEKCFALFEPFLDECIRLT